MNRHRRWCNKYVLTLGAFILIVGFLDENNLMRQWQHAREEKHLREEIAKYRAEFIENTRRLNELDVDSGAIERVARERYLMKKPDEDIYIFKEYIK